MNKFLSFTWPQVSISLVMMLCMTSCSSKDAQYYRLNPAALQAELVTCSKQTTIDAHCEQLQHMAERLNTLAYQLSSNPQGFGIGILQLQQTIGELQQQINKDNTNAGLKDALQRNQRDLADRLAVVKRFESPVR